MIRVSLFILLLFYRSVALGIEAGEQAPQSQELDLRKHAGKLIYLDFWASWCDPCKESIPWLNSLADAYEGSSFKIITVNLDSDRIKAEQFLSRTGRKFDVVFDPEGRLPNLYNLRSMPSSYLIGRDGSVLATYEGFDESHKEKIENDIKNHLKIP